MCLAGCTCNHTQDTAVFNQKLHKVYVDFGVQLCKCLRSNLTRMVLEDLPVDPFLARNTTLGYTRILGYIHVQWSETMTIRTTLYTRAELLSACNQSAIRPEHCLWKPLCELGLSKRGPTAHGCCGGARKWRIIQDSGWQKVHPEPATLGCLQSEPAKPKINAQRATHFCSYGSSGLHTP